MYFMHSYLLIMNAIGLLIMLIDKDNSIRNWKRISEFTLLTIAAIGGSIGIFIGMCLFRHKIKKLRFLISVPMCILLHCSIFYLVVGL